MSIGPKVLLGSLSVACLGVFLALSGCEGTTEEDSTGVDAYIAAHPYRSADREAPLAPVMQISPLQAVVNNVGQTITFTASGGDGVFHWGVTENANGSIESRNAGSALYTCLAVANNDVIVQDNSGHYASAHISRFSTSNSLSISPASVTLSGGAVNVAFAVSGGRPSYTWTSGNTALGAVSYSASSSYVAAYMAVAGVYGQNIITVKDADGQTATATIIQSP